MGDVVMTLPALELLRQQYPDVVIGYVTDSRWQGLLENSGLVDRVHYIDKQAMRQGSFSTRWALIRKVIKELRSHHYQRALDMQSFGETGFLAWISGAVERYAWCKRRSRRLWINHPVAGMVAHPHRIGFFLQFATNDPDKQKPVLKRLPLLRRIAGKQHDTGHVALFIGSSQPVRRWPTQYFSQLADVLTNKGYKVSVLAGPGEQEAVSWLKQNRPDVDCSCFNDMDSLLDILSTAGHLVSGDTGPIHVGGALGIMHIVGLYQDHNIHYSTPFHSGSLEVLHHTDLSQISVSDVADKFESIS